MNSRIIRTLIAGAIGLAISMFTPTPLFGALAVILAFVAIHDTRAEMRIIRFSQEERYEALLLSGQICELNNQADVVSWMTYLATGFGVLIYFLPFLHWVFNPLAGIAVVNAMAMSFEATRTRIDVLEGR